MFTAPRKLSKSIDVNDGGEKKRLRFSSNDSSSSISVQAPKKQKLKNRDDNDFATPLAHATPAKPTIAKVSADVLLREKLEDLNAINLEEVITKAVGKQDWEIEFYAVMQQALQTYVTKVAEKSNDMLIDAFMNPEGNGKQLFIDNEKMCLAFDLLVRARKEAQMKRSAKVTNLAISNSDSTLRLNAFKKLVPSFLIVGDNSEPSVNG